jgi:hypothetical protein
MLIRNEKSYLDSVLPLREVDILLPLFFSFQRGLMFTQTSADSPGLFGAEIERQIFLCLVDNSELLSLFRVEDGQGTSDRLADIVTVQ